MDFFTPKVVEYPKKGPAVTPEFLTRHSSDLMVRGGKFYAIWDPEAGMWSRDPYTTVRMVDDQLRAEREKVDHPGVSVDWMGHHTTKSWQKFLDYVRNSPDNFVSLDSTVTFANTEVGKSDYVSRRLSYPLEAGVYTAWDEIIGTLYDPDERDKLEWAIGAIVAGDAKYIDKFLVLYGPPRSGKSTILGIIEQLFDGYAVTFDAKALGQSGNGFATAVFETNPLVAIQHDGNLSRIEDNAKLNSLISHETIMINQKYQSAYATRVNAMLFMGTNVPVSITDSNSGIYRRLLLVEPADRLIPPERYHHLMGQIPFELGAIAHHCLQRYLAMGKHYYKNYFPVSMMSMTNHFRSFMEENFVDFDDPEGVFLEQIWKKYKAWTDDRKIRYPLQYQEVMRESRSYFLDYQERKMVDGERRRHFYQGFRLNRPGVPDDIDDQVELPLDQTVSIFDQVAAEYPAQYANPETEAPATRWVDVTSKLNQLESDQLHYVQVPREHIVIDFDLVDEDGNKSLEMNLRAAASWPPTYAELSKGGNGVHLHYIYTGDVEALSSVYSPGIEVKTLLGNSSLRRRLSRCNSRPIAELSSGLPTKEKKVQSSDQLMTERGLRQLVERNLRKEIHPGTKPSIDFIKKILDDADEQGLEYDLRDMRARILGFAMKSSNQAQACVRTVSQMRFASSPDQDELPAAPDIPKAEDEKPIVFFDVEVYPNLLLICWKAQGNPQVVRMINPSPKEVGALMEMRLVGFNNRRYDNHILYARYLGHSIEEVYHTSHTIINSPTGEGRFAAAYGISYADIYDFSSKKQSLKKFMVELEIFHMEMNLPWDEPVPEDQLRRVEEYCVNDVIATEAVFESRIADFRAREILASLSGLTVNDTTQKHTARIIFGMDPNPSTSFVYTDLATMFEGYEFFGSESSYRGETPGEGGYVYAEPGIYHDVALLDIASMHPASIEALNLFGEEYTANFSAIKQARLAIKHKDFDTAREMLGGVLKPHLVGAEDDPAGAEALSYALKIAINIVYGLTSARFPNPFKDFRNVDNIVAKRGALFMIDLKLALQEKGVTVCHVKTDSVKIPGATPEIIKFVTEFGARYGYEFEHEATYDALALVNDAVYIARKGDKWTAVGKQFQHPYVYKTLFTGEELTFNDHCETRSVSKGTMYLDFSPEDREDETPMEELVHVGRTGSFLPVNEGAGLLRLHEDRRFAVAGTLGHRWIERDMALARKERGELEIDMSYFHELADDAVAAINNHGSFEEFVNSR